jgi:4-diphosphocytidyl-2-C-methyl-D-erythritol kinase
VSLEIGGAFAAGLSTEHNLILDAARAFLDEARTPLPGLAFQLEKNLPVAAGLGGGSADAAACLRFLRRRFAGMVDADRLHAVAARLGADVTMCLSSAPLRARGRGEEISPVVGLPALPVVLVNPGKELPTRTVFSALALPSPRPLPEPPDGFDVRQLATWLKTTGNDLEGAAKSIEPSINAVLGALAEIRGCLLARMSGSGATCFGIFATRPEAEAAAHALRRERPAWWVKASICRG